MRSWITYAASTMLVLFAALFAGSSAQASVAAPNAPNAVQTATPNLNQSVQYYVYRPRRYYVRRAYRPHYYRPRVVCSVRYRRVWNGFYWVTRPVRVCTRRW